MINLRTRVGGLSDHKVRHIIRMTILWAEKNISKKGESPKFSIRTQKLGHSLYGYYSFDDKKIVVYKNRCGKYMTVMSIIKVTLHEYTHHLQCSETYDEYHKEYGYHNNPYEKFARASEKKYGQCWNEIKSLVN